MNRFWNFSDTGGENILNIDGYIAEESWFGDEVTPKIFAAELNKMKGDLTVYINSGGGDVFAASQIYTMLKEHDGKVTVKIGSLAASAASAIAMAGDTVLMSPMAVMYIHNPWSVITGEVADLERGIEELNTVKEALICAYSLKSGLAHDEISRMMDDETCMYAKSAVELGFADGMMFDNSETEDMYDSVIWSRKSSVTSVVNAMRRKLPKKQAAKLSGTPIDTLDKRLSLIMH